MLLRKCTETSVFIADEAKRTVCVMMENVSPAIIMMAMTMLMSNAVVGFVIVVIMGQVSLVRVVNSLLQHATHKNTAYRSKVALLADHLVDKHGPSLSDRCVTHHCCCVFAYSRAFARLHARPLPADSWHSLLNSVIRDLELIFQAAATGFSCDSAQETRNSGKRLLVSLQPLLQVVQSCIVLSLC
jgi:hypothetical protein